MKKHAYLIAVGILFSLSINAQTPGEEYKHNDIFKGFFGWDIRVGGENSTCDQTNINTVTGDVQGESHSTYKNTRITIDFIDINGNIRFGKKRFRVGIPYGVNVGISPQKYVNTYTGSGYIPNSSWPSGFGGDQGMDLPDNLSINFEMKAGLALAYNIVPAKNLQLSAGYSVRFWSKGNMAFYANPQFFGGFVDVNMTYKRWALNTTFKGKKYNLGADTWGDVKTSYFSIMPSYNMPLRNKEKGKFRNGLNTIGLRIETSSARADNSMVMLTSRHDFKLRANTFMMGVYFGFLL